jgi:predicted ATPase
VKLTPRAAAVLLALAEAHGEAYYDAELHRLRGELLARAHHNQRREALTSFDTSIQIAHQQGAVTFRRKAEDSKRRWL